MSPLFSLRHLLFILSISACFGVVSKASMADSYMAETVVDGLSRPWSLAFFPNGDALITQLGGKLRYLKQGQLVEKPIGGLPKIKSGGQGGLMGVAIHPDFSNTQIICVSYSGNKEGEYSTEVLCGRLEKNTLLDTKIIFTAYPRTKKQKHFGGQLIFDQAGHLYITLGDRGSRSTAQDLSSHNGSLVRLNADGTIPKDNPYSRNSKALPEIFTYGHRNIQGIALHPETGEIWTHEHGPQGGDEINIIRAGANYGWPLVTFGVNYGIGTKIGEGTSKPGLAKPLYKWVPSIAPAGMAFYSGRRIPAWSGDLFVGSLKFGELVRLSIRENKIVNEQRLFDGKYGRIRDVSEGPDGYLYFLTDQKKGKLMRVLAFE